MYMVLGFDSSTKTDIQNCLEKLIAKVFLISAAYLFRKDDTGVSATTGLFILIPM
jgi:hypothetical protein